VHEFLVISKAGIRGLFVKPFRCNISENIGIFSIIYYTESFVNVSYNCFLFQDYVQLGAK
jgi:hypothetical protein